LSTDFSNFEVFKPIQKSDILLSSVLHGNRIEHGGTEAAPLLRLWEIPDSNVRRETGLTK
jgi:hypothetical protein